MPPKKSSLSRKTKNARRLNDRRREDTSFAEVERERSRLAMQAHRQDEKCRKEDQDQDQDLQQHKDGMENPDPQRLGNDQQQANREHQQTGGPLKEEIGASEKGKMNEPSPEVEGRKRTFSSRQKVLEEKKMQQQREEAERMRAEEEKRLQREAKRREKKDKERREAMRVQRIEEQGRNEMSGYYGQNYSVHPALTNKSPSKPSTVIMPEYDAFSEGMTPECIIGATDELGELCFFVKWKGTDDADFVPAKKAKIHCPQLVIRYYENIISWN